MRNHFDLVVETPDANLVADARCLPRTCTIRLNHRYKLAGHVFHKYHTGEFPPRKAATPKPGGL
jgi:hypothetical protein